MDPDVMLSTLLKSADRLKGKMKVTMQQLSNWGDLERSMPTSSEEAQANIARLGAKHDRLRSALSTTLESIRKFEKRP